MTMLLSLDHVAPAETASLAMPGAARPNIPDMTAPARVMVARKAVAGGPVAALFGPFGDCAFVLLREGGYTDAECWVEADGARLSFAEIREASEAGLIHRATCEQALARRPRRWRR
jgi:hypothetical protein